MSVASSPHVRSLGRSWRTVSCAFAIVAALTCALTSLSRAANCDSTSKGFLPINDLGTGQYQGFEGGLYPGGVNVVPGAHLNSGLAQALAIQPLDTLGNPDATNGWIVLLSIGMCNTSQEFASFTTQANGYPGVNPRVVHLNGAQGGQTASDIADPNSIFWDVIDQRLAARGVTRRQVQAIWFKEANAQPSDPFPVHADSLRNQFLSAVRIARGLYLNARLCYLSSRIYAGYASTLLNPEPYAYESGFAVKWLIESQIAGNDSLNFDPANGPVVAPWLAWGPYLWADGLVPRSDGLTWLCSDVRENDGTHPSEAGRNKVAARLLTFLATDTTSVPWFLTNPSSIDGSSPPLTRPLVVHAARPNPFRTKTALVLDASVAQAVRVEVVTLSGRRLRTLATAEIGPGQTRFDWDGTDADGRTVGSGVYFLRVVSSTGNVHSERVTLAR